MIDFQQLDRRGWVNHVDKMFPNYLHRLALCGLARKVQDKIKSKPCVDALSIAENYDKYSPYEIKQAKVKVQNAILTQFARTHKYLARNVVIASLMPTTNADMVLGIASTLIEFAGYGIGSDVFTCIYNRHPKVKITREKGLVQAAKEDYSLFPILADLVEEEGVEQDIMNHLRSDKPHFKGCWAIRVLET